MHRPKPVECQLPHLLRLKADSPLVAQNQSFNRPHRMTAFHPIPALASASLGEKRTVRFQGTITVQAMTGMLRETDKALKT